jgi:hypothetical protein
MNRELSLDRMKLIADIAKWVIAGIAAIVSFYVIDVGKLNLEKFQAQAENQRLLLQAYLNATESVQPDIWKRKLRVLQTYSEDERVRDWARAELEDVENYAEQDALYRETLKIASQLVRRTSKTDASWQAARSRFEQLYWADLPYAKESSEVARSMIDFRNGLLAVDRNPNDERLWEQLDLNLLSLSGTLRQSQPARPSQVISKPQGK